MGCNLFFFILRCYIEIKAVKLIYILGFHLFHNKCGVSCIVESCVKWFIFRNIQGLVYIDNYDEALDSIEDVKRSLLVALIDRKVNKYFTELDALVRKIEKDKYFVVLKYQYLAKLREDRFSLIEDVKTVKVGNEMEKSA